MSDINHLNLKKDQSFLNVSKNSSILLSGRCASTPITASRLSFSVLEPSIGGFDITPEPRSKTKINVSGVPIFGRTNLQVIKDYKNSGKNESAVANILKKGQILRHQFANVEKTFGDVSDRGNVKPCSSGSVPKSKQSIKEIKKIAENKRRSSHNNSQGPVFKVTTKRPKSPRQLTAMRAKLKQARDRIADNNKNTNTELSNVNKNKNVYKDKKKQENCIKQISTKSKIEPTMTYSKYRITIPTSPKLGRLRTKVEKIEN